jgi:hypothetical protein
MLPVCRTSWRAGVACPCFLSEVRRSSGARVAPKGRRRERRCAVTLLAVSGFLLARASLHPHIVAISVAVVAVRALGLGRGVFRYIERLASHDVAFRVLADILVAIYRQLPSWPRPGCPLSVPVTCSPGRSVTWTPPRTSVTSRSCSPTKWARSPFSTLRDNARQ